MRVPLDECLPERLKQELADLHVRTARESGLAGKKNGLLLELAAVHFDFLVTIAGHHRSQPAGPAAP